jgi:hypothetical protein
VILHEHTPAFGERVAVVLRLGAAAVGVIATVDPHHDRQLLGVRRHMNIQLQAVFALLHVDDFEAGSQRLLACPTQAQPVDEAVEKQFEASCTLVRLRPKLRAIQRAPPWRDRLRRPPTQRADRWRSEGNPAEVQHPALRPDGTLHPAGSCRYSRPT